VRMDALGKAFHSFQGRVIDGRRLVKAGKTRTNKVRWHLEKLAGPPPTLDDEFSTVSPNAPPA
jgi:hypothetical protein